MSLFPGVTESDRASTGYVRGAPGPAGGFLVLSPRCIGNGDTRDPTSPDRPHRLPASPTVTTGAGSQTSALSFGTGLAYNPGPTTIFLAWHATAPTAVEDAGCALLPGVAVQWSADANSVKVAAIADGAGSFSFWTWSA